MNEVETLNELRSYLIKKGIFTEDISLKKTEKGGSGATLYEAGDTTAQYIVKNIRNDSIKLMSEKEYLFYSISNRFNEDFLPKVIYTEQSKQYGTIIILKQYADINYQDWDLTKQLKAIDIIAKIHSKSATFIEALKLNVEPFITDAEKVKNSFDSWVNIIDNFTDTSLSKDTLNDIYKNFNKFIDYMNLNRKYFCHGDFHPSNYVIDENGHLILVDWQNYTIGGQDEIAFFISRGFDCGIKIDETKIKQHYCERLSYYMNKEISMFELETALCVHTIFVTYFYWHEYLQGSDLDRVKSLFTKMADSYNWLLSNEFYYNK